MHKVIQVTALVLIFSSVAGAAEAGQRCQAGKNELAGKLAFCLSRAEKKSLLSGNATMLGTAANACTAAFATRWSTLEERAVLGGDGCPTVDDQQDVQGLIAACSEAVAAMVAGTGPGVNPATCADELSSCAATQSACEAGHTACEGDLVGCGVALSQCHAQHDTCDANLGTCRGNLDVCTASGIACEARASAAEARASACAAGTSACEAAATACQNDLVGCGVALSQCHAHGHDCDGNLEECQTNLDACDTERDSCAGSLAECQAQCHANTLWTLTGQTTVDTPGDDADVHGGAGLSYTDNGDGSITDNRTGLMWEKKVGRDDTPSATNLHDADNYYKWGGNCSDEVACGIPLTSTPFPTSGPRGTCCQSDADCDAGHTCTFPNGSGTNLSIFGFIAALNAENFAGHNDWRLPNQRELYTLVDLSRYRATVNPAFLGANCGPTCLDMADPSCSCTRTNYAGYHFSSTTAAEGWWLAWTVGFWDGIPYVRGKNTNNLVRAVRGGS